MWTYSYYDSYNGKRCYNIFEIQSENDIKKAEAAFDNSIVAVSHQTFDTYKECYDHCYSN